MFNPPKRKIDTVRHDNAFPFETVLPQILAGAAAYGPDFVGSTDVRDEKFQHALLEQFRTDRMRDVNVIFRVIGHDEGDVKFRAERPRQHLAREGTVGVQQVRLSVLQLPYRVGVKGEPCAVANQLRRLETGIADHRKRKDAVIRVRDEGYRGNGLMAVCGEIPPVIGDGSGDAVDLRRKSVVKQCNG